jgi:DNA-binding NtrC family response regulator
MFVETVLGTWEAFEVTAVSNASEALALIEYEPWDLVLADFELPDAQALRLLSVIRTEAPGLPFAMITAHPVLPPVAHALGAADGFITKPLRPSALIGLATGLIEHTRWSQEQADG